MPRAPSARTEPPKSGSPRRTVASEPSAVTSSTAPTAVGSEPLRLPDPWVPVDAAPATEMCGSDPRLCSA